MGYLKNGWLFLVLITSLSSCIYHRYLPSPYAYKLTPLPYQKSDSFPPVYSNYTGSSDSDYLFTHVYHINKKPMDRQAIIYFLCMLGKKNGNDALFLLHQAPAKWTSGNTKQTWAHHEIMKPLPPHDSVLPPYDIWAIGIKYAKNIHYLFRYPQSVSISLYDSVSATYHHKTTHYYTFTPTTDSTNGNAELYEIYVQPFEFSFLIHEKNDQWVYRREDSKTLFRDYYADGHLNMSVKIVSDSLQRPKYIKIRYRWPAKAEIGCFYKDSILDYRLIFIGMGPKYIERYTYDEHQRIQQAYVMTIVNEEEKPFLKLEYNYYKNEDWILFR